MSMTNLCKFVGKYINPDYGSRLEEYISTRNPQSVYDVERLTKDYEKQFQETGYF